MTLLITIQQIVQKTIENYTTNCIEANTCQFQINKAIVKLSNVSAVPNAPIAKLYRFVENIVENVDQHQHIVTTSDLNFDMLQHSNLQKELFISTLGANPLERTPQVLLGPKPNPQKYQRYFLLNTSNCTLVSLMDPPHHANVVFQGHHIDYMFRKRRLENKKGISYKGEGKGS